MVTGTSSWSHRWSFYSCDTYTRFLKIIGKENVIFVSELTAMDHQFRELSSLVEDGLFEGTIDDFVRSNHEKQKKF